MMGRGTPSKSKRIERMFFSLANLFRSYSAKCFYERATNPNARNLRGAHHREMVTTMTSHCCCKARREGSKQQSDEEPIERVSDGLAGLIDGGEIALVDICHTGFGLGVIETCRC